MEAKCLKFYEFGNPSHVLKLENKKIDPPINDEILVRMIARPINPSDLIPVRGAYSHRISLPGIPGYEGIGVVEDVGSAASKDLLGKRVLPLRGEGTWQEFVKSPSKLAIPIPNNIDDCTAAQLYINPITAWLICTEILKLGPEDVLLVNACGSFIGRILAQLSKVFGFRLIAVTRNHHHTEELIQLGASEVINTSETSLRDTVMELTNGHGASAAIDSVGGLSGSELAFCIQQDQVLLTIGLLSGIPINWAEISKRTKVKVRLFHLRHWNQKVSAQTWHETFHHLIGLINAQSLQFMKPGPHYRLAEVSRAVQASESPGRRGKVFLKK